MAGGRPQRSAAPTPLAEASPAARMHGVHRDEWIAKLDRAYEFQRHAHTATSPTKSLRTAVQPQITVQPRLGIDRQAFLWEPCVIAKTINASRIANTDGANIHAGFPQLRP